MDVSQADIRAACVRAIKQRNKLPKPSDEWIAYHATLSVHPKAEHVETIKSEVLRMLRGEPDSAH